MSKILADVNYLSVVLAAVAAWPVPDVNETVYLTKALHHVDPAYGRGDWFLETPDAHSAFYAVMGPILAACGLESGAWVGRWLGWLALAVGFRHAVVPLLPTALGRLLAADRIASVEGATLHDYAKAPRRGRKVGHVTVTAPNATVLDERLARLRAVLPGDDG